MGQDIIYSHSADVQIWLECEGHGKIELGRVTPKLVVAKGPHNIPACFANLVVMVDGRCICNPVRILSGFKRRNVARVCSVSDIAPF